MMKYVSILYIRKYWFLAVMLIVQGGSFHFNKNAPRFYKSYSRLAVKLNPLEHAVGNLYASERDVLATNHYENLKIPDEGFLESVSNNIKGELLPSEIEGQYSVRQERGSSLILIEVQTKNATLSNHLADVLAKTYEEYDLQFRQRTYHEKGNWILKQLKSRKKILDSLETEIKFFRKENPKFSGTTVLTNVLNIENELKEISLKKEESEHRLKLALNSLKGLDSVIVSEITRDKPFQKELLRMELELAKLKVDFGGESRKVKKKIEQMNNVKELMDKGLQKGSYTTTIQSNPRFIFLQGNRDEIQAEIGVMSGRRVELEKMLVLAYKKTVRQPELMLRNSRLQRSKSASEKIYMMLSEKLEETKLKKSGVSGEVYQIGRATPSREVIEGEISIGMSLFVGALLSFILIFFLEQLSKTIRFPMQIEKLYGLSLLGVIPELELDSGKLDLDSDSKILEPYRSLRTNLNYTTPLASGNCKSVIVTSALQGEGKSTKAVNLAICFALEGKKVLLVDSDLRRPSVHRLLNKDRGLGLSEYLTGQAEFSDVLQKTPYHGLTITAAGNKMPNPAEILGSTRIRNFLESAYKEFDIIFFDSPAIFPVSDALILAPQMDVTLVVFRSGYTPIKAGEEVLRKLDQVKATVIGGILNDVRSSKGGYYYSYYGYSYYQSYYEDIHPNTKHPWLHAFKKNSLEKMENFFKVFQKMGNFRLMKIAIWVFLVLTCLALVVSFFSGKMIPPDYKPISVSVVS